ncbi:MAG: hypothetical protein KGQ61_03655 [Planctomycetes bacterium]|nr:hypothetical protein [Planctomycetota bacterium]
MVSAPAAAAPWSRPARVAASAAILVYLAAVVVPPLAGPPPASDLARVLIQPLRPLVGTLALGHGYRFFAPNPGPGHSLRYRVSRPDGSSLAGSLPDATADRPRLLYHRRFMVAEKIAALVPQADAPDDVRQRARGDWLPLVRGVAGQVLERHRGVVVEIELVEHHLPGPEEFGDRPAGESAGAGEGEAPGGDVVVPLGTFTWQDAPGGAGVAR